MEEKKIFSKDFRQGLYQALIEAGYDKPNALHLVSLKYHEALKEKVVNKLKETVECLEKGNYDAIGSLGEISTEIETLKEVRQHIMPSVSTETE